MNVSILPKFVTHNFSTKGASILSDIPKGDLLKKIKEMAQKFKPEWDFKDLNWDDLNNLFKSQDVAFIRQELVDALKFVFAQIEYVFTILKKIFYVLPVFFLMKDAYRYMVKYRSDVTFDNMYIDSNMINHDGKHLLPLRRWEKLEKYQVSASLKLSNNEWQSVFLQMIPLLVFITGAASLYILDFSIASFLIAIKEKAKFTISFEGMVHAWIFHIVCTIS